MPASFFEPDEDEHAVFQVASYGGFAA
jgi:hypothetical protein